MRKSTKGAVAASAAALLLLGGMGTQANWTAEQGAEGTIIDSGHLKLINSNCDVVDWLFGEDVFDPETMEIIPGSVLTKKCTFTLDIAGVGLQATLDIDDHSWSDNNDLASQVTVTPTFVRTDNGATISTVTTEEDGVEVEATLTVTLPLGASDLAQDQVSTLNDLSIQATQPSS